MNRFLCLSAVSSCLKINFSTAAISMALRSVDFEVYGRVQGVFFRKFTKEQAEKLALKGWCRNTSRGTVEGQVQGPSEKVDEIYAISHTPLDVLRAIWLPVVVAFISAHRTCGDNSLLQNDNNFKDDDDNGNDSSDEDDDLFQT